MFVFRDRNDASSIKALSMILYLVVALTGCCKSLAWFLGPTLLSVPCFQFFWFARGESLSLVPRSSSKVLKGGLGTRLGEPGNGASEQLFALVVAETQISKAYL